MTKVNPGLAGALRAIATLTPDPRPIREHPERQLVDIAASLERFGQQKPLIVDQAGVVLAGNGTLAAAKRLGWSHVAVREFAGDALHAQAFRLADNRTAELSSWDEHALGALVGEIEPGDLAALGFTEAELELLLIPKDWKPPAVDADAFTPMPAPLKFTREEWDEIEPAVERIKREAGDPSISDGRALELLCAEWLAGPRLVEA